MSGAVTLVTAGILVCDGRILLARRPAGDPLAGQWELPGGKLEPGETPEACLARELAEECGVEVQIGAAFAETTYEYAHADIRLLAYWITAWSGDLCFRVHDAYRWVEPAELEGVLAAPADLPILSALRRELA